MNSDGKLEKKFRPSILDNIEHWKVFRDDEQILIFIHNVQEFSNFNVRFQEEGNEYQGEGNQFRDTVLRGLVTLEIIFDRQDRKRVMWIKLIHGII